MLTTITNAIKPILEEKCFIDCYGGLVRKIAVDLPIPNTNRTRKHMYPISCEKLNECKPNQKYVELLPNDKYTSVSYFESKNGVRRATPNTKKMRQLMDSIKGSKCFSANLRFVMWYNMKKLGYDQCTIADQIVHELTECFCKSFASDNGLMIHLEYAGHNINNIETFQGYSYSDCAEAFGMPPYEYFHIDIVATWCVFPECKLFEPFVCKEPLPC